MNLFAGLESFADELSAFGLEDVACAVPRDDPASRGVAELAELLREWGSQLGSLSA